MLTQGVLFFPVTPFGVDGAIDGSLFEQHVVDGLAHGPGAVFAACGAGELHALSKEEHAEIANRAVKAVAGKRSVYVGAGGPLPTAITMCHAAAKSGADGVLLLPPYLVSAPQKGLIDYVAQVAAAIQPNVARVGGITPFLQIAALGHAMGARVCPHHLPEVSIQLALCIPGEELIEDIDHSSFTDLGILKAGVSERCTEVKGLGDAESGLGLNFDFDRLAAFALNLQ